MLRLGLAAFLFAACSDSGITTYADNDPAIPNGGSGGGSCSPVAFTPTPVPYYVQFMVDGSGTMGDGLNNMNGDNKYQWVRDTLTTTTTGLLLPLENKALFGATIYTSQNTCPKLFTAPCAMNNAANIRSEFGQTGPQVTDPLPEAINGMVTNFNALTVPTNAKKILVIGTDGVPNSCTSNTGDRTAAAVTATQAAFAAGIRTYTIGLGNVPSSFLQPMANAGLGTTTNSPMYVGADGPGITAQYAAVLKVVMACELTLDGTIDMSQASLGTVKSGDTTLAYTTDWEAVDTHTIRLVGTACDTYNAATTLPEITATFTCGASH